MVFDLRKSRLSPVLDKPVRNIAFNIVYAARGCEISYVFVDGRPVVEDGKITIMNAEEVVEKAQKAAEDLAELGGDDYLSADSYLVKKNGGRGFSKISSMRLFIHKACSPSMMSEAS